MSTTSVNILNRLKFWSAYLIISFIVMMASLETNRSSTTTPSSRDNLDWTIACSIITFCLTLIILLIHFLTPFPIIGGKLEGFSIVLSLVCWCALVIVVSKPGDGVAINSSDGSVSNGNIYYFSWAGFLTSSVLLISFLQHAVNVYVPNELASSRFKYWATLLASSVVVLGSSADFFGRICDGNGGTNYCNRCILGIIIGCFGTLFSLIVVTMNIAMGRVPFMLECGFSLLMALLNAFGVAFLTSDKGPGAPLGNLYYFSWLSFVLVFVILYGCWEDYKMAQEGLERDELELNPKEDLSENRTMKSDNRSRKESLEEEEVMDVDLEK